MQANISALTTELNIRACRADELTPTDCEGFLDRVKGTRFKAQTRKKLPPLIIDLFVVFFGYEEKQFASNKT